MFKCHEMIKCHDIIDASAKHAPTHFSIVRSLRCLVILSFMFLISLSVLPADAAEQKAPPIDRGPAIGTKAPAFGLADANGRKTTLAKLTGKTGTILLFYRSADW